MRSVAGFLLETDGAARSVARGPTLKFTTSNFAVGVAMTQNRTSSRYVLPVIMNFIPLDLNDEPDDLELSVEKGGAP